MQVDRLVIVYDSDRGIRGDFIYAIKKVFRGESCSLCEITHVVREKRDWKECRANLGVPVDALYRDEIRGELAAAIDGNLPCVVAKTSGGYELLLGPEELSQCDGSVAKLERALRDLGVGAS